MPPPLPDVNSTGRHPFGMRPSNVVRRAGLYLAAALLFTSTVIAVRTSMGTSDENSVWPVIAILFALPWSLALTLLDLVGGFGDRATWIVAVGFAVNVSLLIAAGCATWRRLRAR